VAFAEASPFLPALESLYEDVIRARPGGEAAGTTGRDRTTTRTGRAASADDGDAHAGEGTSAANDEIRSS